MTEPYRPEGRYLTAMDIANRLMPDLFIHEVLLWSPDLFAYTSYLLAKTSAYQLVVSPPTDKKWQPSEVDISKWLLDEPEKNIGYWLKDANRDWKCGYRQSRKRSIISKKVGSLNEKFALFSKGCADSRGDTGSEPANGRGPAGDETVTQRQNPPEDDKEPLTFWERMVKETGEEWQQNLDKLTKDDCDYIDDTKYKALKKDVQPGTVKERGEHLLRLVLDHAPPLLLACWGYFYRHTNRPDFRDGCKLRITELLCNQDDQQFDKGYKEELWRIAQAVLTMHAIADVASVGFGIEHEPKSWSPEYKNKEWSAREFAEELLFGRLKGPQVKTAFVSGGSLSTFNIERCRVLPKRHNPDVGITLRSISSNLSFHQSAVDVVWRKAKDNPLADRLLYDPADHERVDNVSILLFPYPESVRTSDFKEDNTAQETLPRSNDKNRYFVYDPTRTDDENSDQIKKVLHLIEEANKELVPEQDGATQGRTVDMIVFPEAALSVDQFNELEKRLCSPKVKEADRPSVIIAGVRESKDDIEIELDRPASFPRNAVYCKYKNTSGKGKTEYYPEDYTPREDWPERLRKRHVTPKFKQYKHHRWRLDESQIKTYGLSSALDASHMWESIKVPKRRVSFLNVGDRMTISHLICEDLARQDPIAELIRHVGPTLVVAILMDGPQLKNRWAARYATVLADDPGSSVITLTSIGMVKRHSSGYGLMSRVVGLWNDSESSAVREIELTQGAEAILLTLQLKYRYEKTADGRREPIKTSVLQLRDVIQIYDPTKS